MQTSFLVLKIQIIFLISHRIKKIYVTLQTGDSKPRILLIKTTRINEFT